MSVYTALLHSAVSIQRTGLSEFFRVSGGRDGRPERDREKNTCIVERGERKASGCGDRARAYNHGAAGGFYRGRDENG